MATSPETGDPAATLEEVRENSQDASYTLYGPGMAVISRRDLSALLAAIEAALKLADGWDAESDRLDDLAEKPGTDEEARPVLSGEAQGYSDCAGDLREAIMAALTGAQLGEDGNHG